MIIRQQFKTVRDGDTAEKCTEMIRKYSDNEDLSEIKKKNKTKQNMTPTTKRHMDGDVLYS